MDTLFFIASKLVWGVARPETLIVLGLGLSWAALSCARLRLARVAIAATLVFVVVLAVLPIGDLLLRPLEMRYPANPPLGQVDGIIVLGGAEDARKTALWNQPQLNEGAERFTAAMALAHRFPDARLVFTGGSGALRDLGGTEQSESTVAERFFIEQGLAPGRLVLEGRSRNTAENARLSLELVNAGPDEVWLLVTSAFHMHRAMRSFERAGWTSIKPYPVDYRTGRFSDGIGWNLPWNLSVLNTAVKEYVGLLVYAFMDR